MESLLRYILGSGTRLNLLSHLTRKPRTPTELAAIEKMHVSHVSRALAELRTKGLVEYELQGSRERLYKPTDRGLVLYYMILRTPR